MGQAQIFEVLELTMTRQALLGENGRTIGNSRAHFFSYDYDLHLIRLQASAIQARLRILPVQLWINRSSKLRNPNPFARRICG